VHAGKDRRVQSTRKLTVGLTEGSTKRIIDGGDLTVADSDELLRRGNFKLARL
jgi:hypothetical protein